MLGCNAELTMPLSPDVIAIKTALQLAAKLVFQHRRAISFSHPGPRQRTPSAEGHSKTLGERRFVGWASFPPCNHKPTGLPDPCASPAKTSTPPAAGNKNTETGSASRPTDHSTSWCTDSLSPSQDCPNSSGAASFTSGLSDFLTTPAHESGTPDSHRRIVSHDPAGNTRLQVPLRTATARPTGLGYAHRPLRYPIRLRESRINTQGTQPESNPKH